MSKPAKIFASIGAAFVVIAIIDWVVRPLSPSDAPLAPLGFILFVALVGFIWGWADGKDEPISTATATSLCLRLTATIAAYIAVMLFTRNGMESYFGEPYPLLAAVISFILLAAMLYMIWNRRRLRG